MRSLLLLVASTHAFTLLRSPSLRFRTTPRVAAQLSNVDSTTAELKLLLLASARAFKVAQEAKWEAEESASQGTFATGEDVGSPPTEQNAQVDERLASPLKAEGFGNVELGYDQQLGRLRNETVALIEELAQRNPTPAPFEGWRERGGACQLQGTWRLLFTTGADATFRKTKSTGKAVTFQTIDATKGYFVNSVDFPFARDNQRLRGFRVVVKGQKISDTEVQLRFRRVKLLRRSRFLRMLIIPLPPSGTRTSVHPSMRPCMHAHMHACIHASLPTSPCRCQDCFEPLHAGQAAARRSSRVEVQAFRCSTLMTTCACTRHSMANSLFSSAADTTTDRGVQAHAACRA